MIEVGDEDVIQPEKIPDEFIEERIFLGEDLMTAIFNGLNEPSNNLFDEGLPSRVLIVGSKKWTSGRIKMVLMFEPDEEDIVEDETGEGEESPNEEVSPLDEIRKMAINEE